MCTEIEYFVLQTRLLTFRKLGDSFDVTNSFAELKRLYTHTHTYRHIHACAHAQAHIHWHTRTSSNEVWFPFTDFLKTQIHIMQQHFGLQCTTSHLLHHDYRKPDNLKASPDYNMAIHIIHQTMYPFSHSCCVSKHGISEASVLDHPRCQETLVLIKLSCLR